MSPQQGVSRCMESGGGLNSRAITGCSMFCDMHILTRESQEVMVGTVNVVTNNLASDNNEAVRSVIVRIAISYSWQLNITNSTLSTPVKSGVGVKSKMISLLITFAM